MKPVDVIIDAGTGYDGKGPEAKPSGYAKDVILRVDRADGFVGRNFLVRGALEHGLYVEETDGYLLDRVKFFWAADYGNLTFTSDHGLYKNCDGFGSGDSVVYPGAAPETGEQADKSFYPDGPRINTVVKHCDMRGSALAYSGSMGNAVRITENHIYGNGTGISSDTISASGHPGYPADSSVIDHNYIYSNNLNLFTGDNPEPPVEPVVGVPIGAGVIWPGMNNGEIHDNWIFDNWRYGTMLLSVPDARRHPGGGGRRRRLLPDRGQLLDLVQQQLPRQPHGPAPAGLQVPQRPRPLLGPAREARRADAQRHRLLVGRGPDGRQLLVRQHRPGRHGGEHHRPRCRRAAGHAAR